MASNTEVKKNDVNLAAATAANANASTSTNNNTSAVSNASSSENLAKYESGYTPSASVTQAQTYLNNVINGKPADYTSNYKTQLDDLYNQVMNSQPFKYSINGDALYQQYKDLYTQQGKQAMMDTVGNAAALTGGYGNSWAQTAGQQAYQQYLQNLNSIVPDLYDRAYNRYQQDKTDLTNKLSLTQQMEDSDYQKYQDAYNNWQNERSYASDAYNNERSFDYSQWGDMRDYWNTKATSEQENAYNLALSMLENGMMPSTDIIAKSGLSSADVTTLYNKYKKSSSSSSSKKTSSSSGTQTKTSTVNKNAAKNAATGKSTISNAVSNIYTKILETLNKA